MTTIVSQVDTGSEAFQRNQHFHRQHQNQLRKRIQQAISGDRDRHINRHRERQKLLPRERIDQLVDAGSTFLELSPLAAYGQYGGHVHSAGIVTGIGIIHNTHCMIIANDATVKGGAYYPETVKKHLRAQEIAEQQALPCIYLVDCGGAYLPEQDRVFPDRDHFGNIFYRQCNMSSQGIPQLAAVFGVSTAGAAYIPALADEVVMVRSNATIHLGGPSIVKVAINETVTAEALGGADMHTSISGVSDQVVDTEPQALAHIRSIVANLNRPSHCYVQKKTPLPPRYPSDDITGIVNQDFAQPFPIEEVLARLIDDSDVHYFKPHWGKNLICGTAHIHGYPVGILANNGPLVSDASVKGAHFISLCEQRNIPLLFLQNVPGFMVGKAAEEGGIAKHSAKLVYAMACAKVPRFTVIIGGSYGAGNYGMCGRGFRPNMLFAWPNSSVATMSADIAANVLRELAKSSLSQASDDATLDALEADTRAQYETQSDPYYATSRLWDDGIIEPEQTRDVIGLCLAVSAQRPPNPAHRHVYRM